MNSMMPRSPFSADTRAGGAFPDASAFPKVIRDDGRDIRYRTGGHQTDRVQTDRVARVMTELASPRQLLGALLRWVVVLVPAMLLLGFLSAAASNSGEQNLWFAMLAKPSLYPPAQVFLVVWSVAYVLMGVALSMVASARGSRWRGVAVTVFGLHLLLNLAWSPIFFGSHRIGLSLLDIVAMDVTLAATIALFARVRPVAAWLLVPVMGWILFATVLDWQVMTANPGADGMADPAGSVHVKF
jgi:tryptophan-rich sensory protein